MKMYISFEPLSLLIAAICIKIAKCSVADCIQICIRKEDYCNCSSSNLFEVPRDVPVTTINFYLDKNFIARITKTDFACNFNLITLDLSFNVITFIEDKSFQCLQNLGYLNLFHNKIASVNRMTFFGLSKVQYIPLSSNYLQTIPDLGNLTNLIILDVARNRIRSSFFPPSYFFLTSLTELRLSQNSFNKMKVSDLIYLKAHQITRFICKQCNINNFEENYFVNFTNLQDLNLANCNLSKENFKILLNSLSYATNLKILKLTNIISKYEISQEMLQPLANTVLDQLWLTSSWCYRPLNEGTFSMLGHLTLLQLENVKLTNVEVGAFDGLENLEKLYLENNDLSYETLNLDSGNVFPPNLRLLSLRLNKLYYVKVVWFINLLNLTILDLSSCLIEQIDRSAFSLNRALTELNLASNYLFEPAKTIFDDKVFSQFIYLKTLVLNNNNIDALLNINKNVMMFQNMTNLNVLYLNNIQLSNLPVKFFSGLDKLTDLYLQKNYISSWNADAFMPLKSLSILDLSSNLIQVLNPSSILFWQNYSEIDLSGNQFNCWCDMIWFRQKLNHLGNITFKNYREYKCGSPKKYEHQTLYDIALEELTANCTYPPWLLYVITSGCVAFIFVLLLSLVANRYRWYIKWYVYRCLLGSPMNKPHANALEQRSLLDADNEFDVYISYGIEDELWAEVITNKLEQNENCNTALDQSELLVQNDQTFSHISIAISENMETDNLSNYAATVSEREEQTQNLHSVIAPEDSLDYSTQRLSVYFEKRDSKANKSQLGQLAEAIYHCRNVIVGVSLSYLEDYRRQFELDLMHTAMVERYGYAAKSHIVLVALQETGELMHKLPELYRSHFTNSALSWCERDEMQQKVFWVELIKRFS